MVNKADLHLLENLRQAIDELLEVKKRTTERSQKRRIFIIS